MNSMKADDLDTKSNEELSELFAVEVCDQELRLHGTKMCRVKQKRPNGDVLVIDIEPFATDANAVLPWLEKYWPVIRYREDRHGQRLWDVDFSTIEGRCDGIAPTFARAACIALLRRKRGCWLAF